MIRWEVVFKQLRRKSDEATRIPSLTARLRCPLIQDLYRVSSEDKRTPGFSDYSLERIGYVNGLVQQLAEKDQYHLAQVTSSYATAGFDEHSKRPDLAIELVICYHA